MNAKQRHDLLRQLSDKLSELNRELTDLGEQVPLRCDRWVLRAPLVWEAENAAVVAKHQIGKALDDSMSYYDSPRPGVPESPRTLPHGVTIEEANREQLRRAGQLHP